MREAREDYEILSGPSGDKDLTRRDLWRLLGAGSLLIFNDRLSGQLLSTRLHVASGGVQMTW